MRAITEARVEQHALGMLMTPVKPDIARNVLYLALNGDLYAQWELFSLMEEWDRLNKNLNEVKNAVKRLSWTVTPYAERGEEPSDSAQAKADLVQAALKNWEPEPGTLEYSFEDSIYNALDAMGKGIAVQEIHWHRRDGAILPRAAHLLTPRQYAWDSQGSRIGLISNTSNAGRTTGLNGTRGGSQTWERFPENQFLISTWNSRSGVPGATAMLRSLVPYWIGMTYGWRWLMQTAQLFGVPFRWATYDQNETGLSEKIGTMLENMGASGWAAFPQGTVLEFKEAVTSARDNPQAVIIEMAKKACDLLILGQELSSESSPTGLGSGTALLQGQVRQDVLKHAATWVADVINYQLIPAVLDLNYGERSESPCVAADLSMDPDPMVLANRDQVLGALGMKLPTAWMYERHGVPEPEEGEAVIEAPAAAPQLGGYGSFGAKNRTIEIHAKSATDQIVDAALEDLTGVQAKWLGGVKPFFRRLVEAARDERISDAELLQVLEAANAEFPELFHKIDHAALATALEAAMGAACVNGAVKGFLERKVGAQ
ncbi:MAG TPA: DUF935 family protein [Candidatus Acidoferrum sp.]|nr:DUF935 family protein [Candidatus Acidoferrum sp.]